MQTLRDFGKKIKSYVLTRRRIPEPEPEQENYGFVIFGLGCGRDKRKELPLQHYNGQIKYKKIFRKCYEHKSIKPVLLTIGDRSLNPFNFPHRNFSKEIRDTKSMTKTKSRKTLKIKKDEDSIKQEKETEYLLQKVKKRLMRNKDGTKDVNVYVAGHSYGGLILNRLCEELQKIADTDPEFKEILKTHFKALAVNSIYVTNTTNIKDVNLINYMNIGDVAIRLNRFEFGFGWHIPSRDIIQSSPINTNMDIKYIYEKEKKLVWYENNNYEPIPDNNTLSLIIGTSDEWKRHNSIMEIIQTFFQTGENSPEE